MMEQVSKKEQPKTAMTITEYNSKIRKSIFYDKVINNPIYRRRWKKAID